MHHGSQLVYLAEDSAMAAIAIEPPTQIPRDSSNGANLAAG